MPMKRERAKTTAPASFSTLDWKFPSHGWFEDVEAQVNYERLIDWLQNFKINLQTNDIQHPVSDLPKIEGSALVIDKSMASIQFFKQLKHIKDYSGTLVVCDRALYHTINYNPSGYVCNLDSSYLCWGFFDRPEVKAVMDKITAVFAATTHPLTVRHWHGPKFYFVPYMNSLGLTKVMMEKTGAPQMPTGGQVASFAYILAYNLGAKDIGIFGVTNSYDSIRETEYPGVQHDRIEGKYGTVWQDPVYRFYNDYYLYFIEEAAKNGVKTYNCSKSGLLYSDDIIDISLEEFVKKHG